MDNTSKLIVIKHSNHVSIDADIFDSGLTVPAQLLLLYLTTRPESWQPSIEELTRQFPQHGKKYFRNLLNELEQNGYLVRAQTRQQGRYACLNLWCTLEDAHDLEKALTLITTNNYKLTTKLTTLREAYPEITPSSTANADSDLQNEKPQVTTDVPFGDFGADLGIVENFLEVQKEDDLQNEKPQVTPTCPLATSVKGTLNNSTSSNSTFNRNSSLVVTNNQPTNKQVSKTCLGDSAESQNESGCVGRMDGDVGFEFRENLPANWQAEFEELANQTINRNRLKDARVPYSQLLLEGYMPDEILQAWCKKQDACKTAGIEERYYPQLYRWLCGNGNSDVYADLAEVREASKIKLPSLASIAVKYWADTAIAEMYTELTEHPDDRETNMRLRDRIFARANELEANLCPA